MMSLFNSQKGDILIVDDNPENLKVLSTVLKKNKYRLRVALDGKIALNSVRKAMLLSIWVVSKGVLLFPSKITAAASPPMKFE